MTKILYEDVMRVSRRKLVPTVNIDNEHRRPNFISGNRNEFFGIDVDINLSQRMEAKGL